MKKSSFLFVLFALMSLPIIVGCTDHDDTNDEKNVMLSIAEDDREVSFSPEADQKEISLIVKNTDFTVQVYDGTEWLSALKTDQNTVAISVAENPQTGDRKGVIRVKATADETIYEDITITQAGRSSAGGKESTDFMFTLICPNEDLECADFVVTYISNDGKKTEQTLTKADFKKSPEEYLTYGIDGSAKIKLNDNEQYWQLVEHFDNFDLASTFAVHYVAKKSHKFNSKAGLSVKTSKDDSRIDSKMQTIMLNANCTMIGIGTDAPTNQTYYWFGYNIDVNAEGKITATSLAENDLKHLSDVQKAYLANCIKGLIDAAYEDVDKIIAVIPEGDEEVNEEYFTYSGQLPADIFGAAIDVAWEVEPYKKNRMFYGVKVKKATDKNYSTSYGTIESGKVKEQLLDEEFRKEVIRDFEIAVYNLLQKK